MLSIQPLAQQLALDRHHAGSGDRREKGRHGLATSSLARETLSR